jgi:hypothetical protein
MLPAASEALLHHATTRGIGSRMAGAESATVDRITFTGNRFIH